MLKSLCTFLFLSFITSGSVLAAGITFDTTVNIRTELGTAPGSIVAHDFDGDGKMDFATANFADNNVSVIFGRGDGTCGVVKNYTVGTGPRWIVIGDVNGDGKTDLITASQNSDDVVILLGNGDGTFGTRINIPMGSHLNSVNVGDLNGDSKLDLIVCTNNSLKVLLGNGDGTFAAAASLSTGADWEYAVAMDLNGDAKPDIAAVETTNNKAVVFMGNGDGTFAAAVNYSVGTFPYLISVADINKDSKPDLVIANVGSTTISVLLNQSGGTFSAATNFTVNDNPYALAIADFNQDGNLDLAVPLYPSAKVDILLGNGAGSFAAPTQTDTWGENAACVAVDINNDGKMDLATVGLNTPNMSILLGAGDASFSKMPPAAGGLNTFGAAAGDLNGDHKVEIVTANRLDGSMSVFPARGDGTFDAPTQYAAGNLASQSGLADLNGDGKLDVVIVNYYGNSISVRLGNGDGTFGAKTDYPVGTLPMNVVFADFNGDHKLDLAVANSGGSLSIYLGNGAGAFTAAANCAINANPGWVAAGDFNHDGFIDLAAPNINNGTISVVLGAGNGTFGAPTSFATGLQPRSVAVADFNHDGHPDLAVSNGNSSSISVLLGTGTGSFGAASSIATGGYPNHVLAADFDGDGNPDLATANSSGNTVSVFRGLGNGQFAAPASFALQSASELAAGDFNGDGRTDLAVVGFGKVRLLLNTTRNYQTITFTHPDMEFTTDPTDLNATTTSPLPISYSVQSGPASIVNNKLVVSGLGQVTVRASQGGDANFYAASDVDCTFNVTKITAVVTLGNLTFTYDGSPKSTTAMTNPSGKTVDILYDGSPNPPTNAGSYAVSATINDSLYRGSATGTLVIDKAAATVTLGNLNFTYDGTAKNTTATTNPPGKTVAILYASSPNPPTSAGSYAVSATVTDANFQGSATDTLVVSKAAVAVLWNTPGDIVAGTPLSDAQLNATASVAGSFTYSPARGTAPARGDAQVLSVSFAPADQTNYLSASASVLLNVLNAPPIASSFPFANPSPAETGQRVVFSAAYSDVDGDALAYTWDFGDGTSSSALHTTHVYSAPSIYTVSLTVNDGHGASVTSKFDLTVQVNDNVAGAGDTDGDGFTNAIELAAGTSPLNAADTPFGGQYANPIALTAVKLSTKLNFVKPGSDSLTLSASLNAPTDLALDGARLLVDIGGNASAFTLDKSGRSKVGNDQASVKSKGAKSSVSIKRMKGNFWGSLTACGLVNETVKTNVTIPVMVIFNGIAYEALQPQMYKGVKDRGGSSGNVR
jgi:PKD repeat protein